MTQKETILFRLTELMFQKQQTFLLLDELYEDEVIGSSIRNIQIDSPFQQLLFEGVLSQTNNDNSISISFTHEKFFHFIVGEHLYKNCNLKTGKAITSLALSNKLNGLKEGIAAMLIKDIDNGIFTRLTSFIDDQEIVKRKSFICTIPFVHSLKTYGVKISVDKLLKKATQQDLKVLETSVDCIEGLQELVLLKEVVNYSSNKIFKKQIDVSLDLLFNFLDYSDIEAQSKILNKIKVSIKTVKNKEDLANYNLKLAFFYRENGDYDNALKKFQKVLKVRGDEDASILNHLGATLDLTGNSKKAYDYYNKSLNILISTNSKSSILDEVFYNLARHTKDFNVALDLYNKALNGEIDKNGNIDLSVAKTLLGIGHLYSKNKDFVKARECFDKSLQIQEKLAGSNFSGLENSYGVVGTSFFESGNMDLALVYYKKSHEIAVINYGNENLITIKNLKNIALTKLWMKDFDLAIIDYECLIKIKEATNLIENKYEVFWIYFNYSQCLLEVGNYYEALNFLDKISSLQKNNGLSLKNEWVVNILFNRGLINYHLGNSDEAILNFEQLLINKSSYKEVKLDSNYYLGNLHYDADNYDKASIHFEKYIHKEKQDFNVLKRLAYSYCKLSEYNKAIKIYKKILSINNLPEVYYCESYDCLGLCFYNLKNYTKAILFYKKAINGPFNGVDLYNSISNCYYNLNRKTEAFNIILEACDLLIIKESDDNKRLLVDFKDLAIELCRENELPDWIKEIK